MSGTASERYLVEAFAVGGTLHEREGVGGACVSNTSLINQFDPIGVSR